LNYRYPVKEFGSFSLLRYLLVGLTIIERVRFWVPVLRHNPDFDGE